MYRWRSLKKKRRDMAHVHKALILDINNWAECVARRCAHMSSLQPHFRRTLSHPGQEKKETPSTLTNMWLLSSVGKGTISIHYHLQRLCSGHEYHSGPALIGGDGNTTPRVVWVDGRWCINSFPYSSVWTSVQLVSSETDVNSDRRSIVTALHAAFCC